VQSARGAARTFARQCNGSEAGLGRLGGASDRLRFLVTADDKPELTFRTSALSIAGVVLFPRAVLPSALFRRYRALTAHRLGELTSSSPWRLLKPVGKKRLPAAGDRAVVCVGGFSATRCCRTTGVTTFYSRARCGRKSLSEEGRPLRMIEVLSQVARLAPLEKYPHWRSIFPTNASLPHLFSNSRWPKAEPAAISPIVQEPRRTRCRGLAAFNLHGYDRREQRGCRADVRERVQHAVSAPPAVARSVPHSQRRIPKTILRRPPARSNGQTDFLRFFFP